MSLDNQQSESPSGEQIATQAAPISATGVVQSPVPTELHVVGIEPTDVRCRHCVQEVRMRVAHHISSCNWIAVFSLLLCVHLPISNCTWIAVCSFVCVHLHSANSNTTKILSKCQLKYYSLSFSYRKVFTRTLFRYMKAVFACAHR